MLDIQYIRENREQVEEICKRKNIKLDIGKLLDVDAETGKLQREIQDLREKKNANTEKIKSAGGVPEKALVEEGRRLKEEISKIEPEFNELKKEFNQVKYGFQSLDDVIKNCK